MKTATRRILGGVVCSAAEETLNSLLDAEADRCAARSELNNVRLCTAARHKQVFT
jgi:hypothetical protein